MATVIRLAMLLTLAGCVVRRPVAEVWRTTGDARERLTPQPTLRPTRATSHATEGATARTTARASARVTARVRLFPDSTRQTFLGVGAALTDASAMLVRALPTARRDSLWRALFSADGAGLAVLRLPLGASDYSLTHYSYADTPGQATADLSVDDSMRVPLLRAAQRLRPSLTLIGAPWSAPAWLKTTDALIGGTLRADAESSYTRYLVSVLDGYEARGLPLHALSLQNEPGFAPTDYPGMVLSSAQRARLVGRWLGPALRTRATPVRLLEWDHNWDRPEEPLAVLADSLARAYIGGVAWHCYAGDVAAQRRVRAAHPHIDAFVTECSGGAWAPVYGDNLRWNARTLLIGALVADARALVLWNLALDPTGGPHRGGCTDCRGVITIDTLTGRITPNVEYDVLAHLGRFVDAGDRRIVAASSEASVAVVAFCRARDGRRVVVLLNDGTGDASIALESDDRTFRLDVPPGALVTVVLPPP